MNPEILVEKYNNDRLKVTTSPPTESVNLLLNSLISAKRVAKKNYWLISVPDFWVFRKKLDELKIPCEKVTDDDTYDFLMEKKSERIFLQEVKEEKHNQYFDPFKAKMKTKLFPDQIAGTLFHFSRGKSGNFDECGLGKTIQMLATVVMWMDLEDGVKHTLVLCPNDVKGEWKNEVKKHTNLNCMVIRNGTENCLEDIGEFKKGKKDIFIVHYEAVTPRKVRRVVGIAIVNLLFCIPLLLPIGAKVEQNDVLEALLGLDIDVCLIDEAHRLKNLGGKTTKAVFQLVKELEK